MTQANESEERASQSPPADRAVRLIFEYDANGVRLVSQQPVNVTPPPGEAAASFQGRAGFWLELRDDQRSVLYRRAVSDPTLQQREVFSQQPGETIVRADAPVGGAFTMLVPALSSGTRVALMGTPPADAGAPRGAAAPEAQEIVEFPLDSPPAAGEGREP